MISNRPAIRASYIRQIDKFKRLIKECQDDDRLATLRRNLEIERTLLERFDDGQT